MKKYILLLLTTIAFAQTPTRNIAGFGSGFSTNDMDSKSLFEVRSTTKGSLFAPKMTTTQKNAIASPTLALTVFDTTIGQYQFYNGSAWVSFGGGDSQNIQQVLTIGNEATIPFIVKSSTTDSKITMSVTDDLEPLIEVDYVEEGNHIKTRIGGGSISVGDWIFSIDGLTFGNASIDNYSSIAGGDIRVGSQSSDTGINSQLIPSKLIFKKGNANRHELDYINPIGVQTHTFQNSSGVISHLSDIPTLDATPTNGNTTHAVSSDGVFDALATKADSAGSTSVDFQVPTIPVGANSAASRNFVENLFWSTNWKKQVKCSTTANHSLSGTSNVDGVTIPAGTRVLAQFQTTPSQNGIYISAAGAWARASDCDSAEELESCTVTVTNGTLYGKTIWNQNLTISTIDTDAAGFINIPTAGALSASNGLEIVSNVVGIATGGVTNAMLAGSIAQSKITNLATDLATITSNIATNTSNIALKANIASPTFTGTVTIPNGSILGTPTSINLSNATFPTLNQNTTGSAATVTTTISSGATATTQSANDNSTKVATTAYVDTADALKYTTNTGWTSYGGTSTIVGFSSTTISQVNYIVIGKLLFLSWEISGTSNATTFTFTIPQTSAAYNQMGNAGGLNNTSTYGSSFWAIDASTSVMKLMFNNANPSSTTTWTNTGTKYSRGTCILNIQ